MIFSEFSTKSILLVLGEYRDYVQVLYVNMLLTFIATGIFKLLRKGIPTESIRWVFSRSNYCRSDKRI